MSALPPPPTPIDPPRRTIPVQPVVAYILAIFLFGPPAIVQGNNLLVWLFVLVLALGLLGAIGSRLCVARLSVRRLLPRQGEVGLEMRLRYQVTRQSRWSSSFCLGLSDTLAQGQVDVIDPARIMHVGPGDTVHGDAFVIPRQRGRLELREILVTSSFPFGVFRRTRRFAESRDLVIYPRRHELRPGVLEATRASGPDGPRSSNRRGPGHEWYGARPARPGDALRDIAWKISAHRDELICLDRVLPSPPRMRVVLDLRRPTDELVLPEGQNPRQAEEDAIELAASMLHMLAREGYESGLTLIGVAGGVPPLRLGTWHLHRMLTSLAEIDLDVPRRTRHGRAQDERCGVIVIAPDRVRPLAEYPDGMYVLARQLADLRVDASDTQ